MASTSDTAQHELREAQLKQAEELLTSAATAEGFARGLFRGQFQSDSVLPYPTLTPQQCAAVGTAVAEVTAFCDQHLNPEQIDRDADIPGAVIDGLAKLGVLGMTAPSELGGRGFHQLSYGRIMEVIGGRCSSTAIFVNAHHSIGMRALLLFGTPEQQRCWLPDLISGRRLAAFALTEEQAGSDAGNVQTMATPSEDGSHFLLTGTKRYITNGAIADVLTVMARTPVPGTDQTAVTAFLVTPDMPGFEVTEPRMPKLGIRGTATAKLAFRNMPVPATNILGLPGRGLKVALTVLDYGRTTFGACCTGAAKTCLELAVGHAKTRRQFGRTLSEFELIRGKIARMAAWTWAMEAMTTVTASLIDRDTDDYMLETAILKVWSTERLWTIVNDTFQIHGGAAYFTDCPLERLLRDHRINLIGEGANEVLLSFIALAGMRSTGIQLKGLLDAARHPLRGALPLARFAADWTRRRWEQPEVPVRTSVTPLFARDISLAVARFGRAVEATLIHYGEDILDRQLELERIAEAAMELYASACVLSRWDHETATDPTTDAAIPIWFLKDSLQRVHQNLDALRSPDDQPLLAAAERVLR